MGLSQRLAIIAALSAGTLIFSATEISLYWTERSNLDDVRQEAIVLANTLASYLTRLAPNGDPQSLASGLAAWSGKRLAGTTAAVFVKSKEPHGIVLVAATDSTVPMRPRGGDLKALETRTSVVWLTSGEAQGWNVATPIGTRRPVAVLQLSVSTARFHDWASRERQRAYILALTAALLLAGGIALLTSRWVGRPLAALGQAFAGAHAGAQFGPPATELGPPEFRQLARRYNELRTALADRERESEARAALQALEERARSFDRLALMEETTATFAHEIGTPLNTMSGHFQLLRDDLEPNKAPDAVRRVNLLLGQVERVAGIVRAWLRRGAWPQPTAEAVDLLSIIRRILDFMEPSCEDAGVATRLIPGAENDAAAAVMAECDPALVEQILLNLLKNAIEALRPGGQITVAAGHRDGSAWIVVADNGPGLAEEAKAHLFNPFATTKGPGGTGLGLTVSRRLARTMGGDLTYEPSERGTAWRLTLRGALEGAHV